MERHANKGKRGVRVFFLMSGTDQIYSAVVKSSSGNRLIFHGGSWCHKKDCYITQAQCRRGTGEWTKSAVLSAKSTIERAAASLEEADARLQGLLTTIDEGRA